MWNTNQDHLKLSTPLVSFPPFQWNIEALDETQGGVTPRFRPTGDLPKFPTHSPLPPHIERLARVRCSDDFDILARFPSSTDFKKHRYAYNRAENFEDRCTELSDGNARTIDTPPTRFRHTFNEAYHAAFDTRKLQLSDEDIEMIDAKAPKKRRRVCKEDLKRQISNLSDQDVTMFDAPPSSEDDEILLYESTDNTSSDYDNDIEMVLDQLPDDDPTPGAMIVNCRTGFQKLPDEISLMIFNYTIEPRDVHIKFDHETEPHLLSDTKIPVVLHLCRMSRYEALKKYKLAFGTLTHEPKIYFNFDIDTLHFGLTTDSSYLQKGKMRHHFNKWSRQQGDGNYEFRRFCSAVVGCENFERVRHLAIGAQALYGGGSWILRAGLPSFPFLKQLDILWSNADFACRETEAMNLGEYKWKVMFKVQFELTTLNQVYPSWKQPNVDLKYAHLMPVRSKAQKDESGAWSA